MGEKLRRKIADCRELYLECGGAEHDLIEQGMHERGWTGFSKRSLYARTKHGKRTPGWPERFAWDTNLQKPARQQGRYTQRGHNRRSKPGVAYANRSARVSTCIGRTSSFKLTEPKPKFNRQKARRLRRSRERSLLAGNAGAPACHRVDIQAPHPNSIDSTNSTDPTNSQVSFHAWLKTMPGIWTWDWKHQLFLYEHLQKVTDGKCKRLMIFMPPRHGKSELVTVRYAAWRLKRTPEMNIILGSYNQHLANNFSRKIRRVLCEDAALSEPPASAGGESVEHQPTQGTAAKTRTEHADSGGKTAGSVPPANAGGSDSPFPFTRTRPKNSEAEWGTTAGGGLKAVGVGAGVTGYGANLIIIDDPVKSRAEADSKRYRDKLWRWFNDDLYTRLEPDGAVILIQTRWHEDDLAGRLINEMDQGGRHWTVVNLPAIAEPTDNGQLKMENKDESEESNSEIVHFPISIVHPKDPLGRPPGEALCPERYDVEALEELRRSLGAYSFSALYQQRPSPAEGGLFKRAWFKRVVKSAPAGLKWARGYDLAISTRTTADYTASFRCAFDREGNLYIADGFCKRMEVPEQRRYLTERIKQETDTDHGIEAANHALAVVQDLRRDRRLNGRRFRSVKVDGDKHARASAWAALAEEGKLILVRGHWNDAFIEEAVAFPNAAHDDQIDAVSIAVRMLREPSRKLFVF